MLAAACRERRAAVEPSFDLRNVCGYRIEEVWAGIDVIFYLLDALGDSGVGNAGLAARERIEFVVDVVERLKYVVALRGGRLRDDRVLQFFELSDYAVERRGINVADALHGLFEVVEPLAYLGYLADERLSRLLVHAGCRDIVFELADMDFLADTVD